MKKEVILLLVAILLISSLVQAQTYSGLNRFTDNVKLFFSSGDNKVMTALAIREKEVDSAIENSQNQEEKAAIKNLEGAYKKLQIVQEKVSLDVVDEIKESVGEIVNKIEGEEDLSDNFDVYILEEMKTNLTAVLTEEIFEYCKELAEEDFTAMLKEEECNPETAIPGLEKELEELKDIQLKMFVQLMLEIRSCIDDPGTCNCEANVDVEQKAKCEKMVALAIKCEYNEDETSCSELKSMEPKKGDSFAESFVPDFLKNLFKEKEYMIGYDIEPSCGVPKECWDDNDKPECKEYDYLKETKDDWDEYGNFIGTEVKCDTEGQIPTMQESVPECFDGDIFLEEKCGEIIIVKNEEGMVNYIVKNQVDAIMEDFENKSAQHTIEANESDGQMQVQNKIREIKKEINTIDNDIKDWVVDHPVMDVDSDDGLTWQIKTDFMIDGDDGLTPDVVTNGDGGGNVVDNDVAPGPQGIVGDAGDGEMAPGTSGGAPSGSSGGDCGEGVECGGEDVIDSPAGDDVIDNGGTLDDTDASDDVAGVDED